MNVWKKQTVRKANNGEKETLFSKRFYGTLTLADGRKKQMPLMEDEKSSLKMLIRLQIDEDKKKALGITDEEQRRFRDVQDVLNEYVLFLKDKGNTSEYVKTCSQRLSKIFNVMKTKTLSEMEGGKVLKALNAWKRISLETKNHYIRALKCFSKYLLRERQLNSDPFIGLKTFNSKTDRRRVRRAFTQEEMQTLLQTVEHSGKRYLGIDWQFLPVDRVMLYRIAASTGLRAKEIASLTVKSFDFEAKTVRVNASNTKNRQEAVLPLTDALCSSLPEFFKRLKTDRLFPGSWIEQRMAGKLLERDLKRSGIPSKDANGKTLDFHSLRYTFISSLARGNVHPSKAQRLARHSTIALTMDVYTQLDVEDLREAVNILPSF